MKTLLAAAAVTLLGQAITPSHAALPADVLAVMDTSVDPCEDFYQYSCGGWLKNYTLPEGVARHRRPFTDLEDQAEAAITKIALARYPMLGELFDSCMDTKSLNTLGNMPIQARLARIQNAKSKFELAKLGGEFGPMNAWLFTNMGFFYNEYNQSQTALFAGTAELPLPSDAASTYNDTTQYILTAFALAGVKLPTNTSAVVDAMLDINAALYKVTPSLEEFRAVESLRYKDAVDRFPIGFKGMAEGARVRNKSALKADSDVFFSSIGYFDGVEKTVWNVYSLETIKWYFTFGYIRRYARYLSDAFMDNENFYWIPAPDRQTRCVQEVVNLLPDLVNEHYFEMSLGVERQQYVKQMVQVVQRAMADHIAKLDWLDASTRAAAEEKLSMMLTIVGKQAKPIQYPFKLHANTFFDNLNKINTWQFQTGLTRVNTPVDRTLTDGAPGVVNAWNEQRENKIVITVGFLQFPFFSLTSHPARNFGSMGATIGHEMTHGYDTEGRKHDGLGVESDWWTDNDKQEYDAKAQCMIEQYNQFVIEGSNGTVLGRVDGNLTLGENIADNGGLRLAFDALKMYMSETKNVPSNGLEPEEVNKLFFVTAGQDWCAKGTDAWLLRVMEDVHAIHTARVNVVMMNNPDFARTFQCKAGSKMNPIKKCVVW